MEYHRWEEDGIPSEAELRLRLISQGLSPYSWSNAPGDRYEPHTHIYTKVLYCVKGSIIFDFPDSETSLQLYPGDMFILPPGVRHSALVGPEGVTCIEAPRYDS